MRYPIPRLVIHINCLCGPHVQRGATQNTDNRSVCVFPLKGHQDTKIYRCNLFSTVLFELGGCKGSPWEADPPSNLGDPTSMLRETNMKTYVLFCRILKATGVKPLPLDIAGYQNMFNYPIKKGKNAHNIAIYSQ